MYKRLWHPFCRRKHVSPIAHYLDDTAEVDLEVPQVRKRVYERSKL